MDSILGTIKTMLNVNESDNAFDTEIIVHINTAFMALRQLGIGPKAGFSISDESTTWSDFEVDMKLIESVKSYAFLKTKLIFDPPSSSSVIKAYTDSISEIEWRLHNYSDYEKEVIGN